MDGSVVLSLDIKIDVKKFKDDTMLPEIVHILREVRPNWGVENIRCKVFTEGISNVINGYYEEGKFDDDVVLVRVYGEGTDLMIERDKEREYERQLSKQGIFPPLYCTFENGIVYGFVHGVILDVDTVREKHMRRLIAKELCKLHSVQLEGLTPEAGFLQRVKKFLDLSPDHFDDQKKQERYLSTIKPKVELEKEYEELKECLERDIAEFGCKVVFSHNDLATANIIYNEKEDKVTFIDYEWAMFNYQPFDIAGHFTEYAGIDGLDVSRYPDKAYQLVWIRYYLECWEEQHGRKASEVKDVDVERWYVMVNKFAWASHLYIGLWGLIQAEHSLIDYDFLEYAERRFYRYFVGKEEMIGLKFPS